MKLKGLLVASICLLLLSYGCKKDFDVKPQPAASNKSGISWKKSSWMYDIFYTNPYKPLNQIAMPGAHDAATYKIKPGNDWASDAAWYFKLVGTKPAYYWSFTTRKSIYGLLEIGVRNFDLRIEHNDKGYFSYHGLVSTPFEEIANDFKRFITENSHEIIHIEFRGDLMTQDEYNQLVQKFLDIVGKDKFVSSNDRLYPTSPIMDYWLQYKNIILSAGRKATANLNPYLRSGFFQYTWANEEKSADVENYLYNHIHNRNMGQMYASSFTQTPTADAIVHGAFAKPKSLEDLACTPSKYGAVNAEIDTWLPRLVQEAESHGKTVNVITTDFPEFNDITGKIISLNLK